MAGKRIYETEAVKAFAAQMSLASRRKRQCQSLVLSRPPRQALARGAVARIAPHSDPASLGTYVTAPVAEAATVRLRVLQSSRKHDHVVSARLKITPEIEASMRATEAELDAAMRDPSFRAEHEEMMLRYDMQEAVAKLFAKAMYAKRFAALPKRRRYALNITVGAGEPVEVRELVH